MVCFRSHVPTKDNPRPGISKTEYGLFYLNYVIKCSAYFPTLILSFWLTDAGYTVWEVSYAWTGSVLAGILAPLILGSISDSCKMRIPLLSLSAFFVGVCDISLPYILNSQPVWVFCVVIFLHVFFANEVACDVWLVDWLPEDVMASLVNEQIFYNSLTKALACSLAALLYEPVGPDNIFNAYGVLSLFSALLWLCHNDNPLGMESTQFSEVTPCSAAMDGPLKQVLPDTGCFLLGWPLFIVCTLCLSFEATIISGIYSSGLIYSGVLGVPYYMIAIIPIVFLIILTGAQTLSKIISERLVAAVLVMGVIGSILPLIFGIPNTSYLLALQYTILLSANYYIFTVIWTILLALFNEAWKARLLALFLTVRGSFEVVGVYAAAAIFLLNDDLLLPYLMACSVCMYVFFEVASWSLPPAAFKTPNDPENSRKSYNVLA